MNYSIELRLTVSADSDPEALVRFQKVLAAYSYGLDVSNDDGDTFEDVRLGVLDERSMFRHRFEEPYSDGAEIVLSHLPNHDDAELVDVVDGEPIGWNGEQAEPADIPAALPSAREWLALIERNADDEQTAELARQIVLFCDDQMKLASWWKWALEHSTQLGAIARGEFYPAPQVPYSNREFDALIDGLYPHINLHDEVEQSIERSPNAGWAKDRMRSGAVINDLLLRMIDWADLGNLLD